MHIPSEKVYNKMRTEIASLWYVLANDGNEKWCFKSVVKSKNIFFIDDIHTIGTLEGDSSTPNKKTQKYLFYRP